MPLPRHRTVGRALAGLGCTAALALGGCTQVRDHKGYVVDSLLINSVAPGVDNRDSVQKTLGRPSFASEFDRGASWYYISRDTKAFAFGNASPTAQTLLTVRFNPDGDVISVQRTGLETIRRVTPYGKKTPTRGSHRSFFADLFGNIGTGGGSGTAAPSQDNPEG